LIDALCAFFFIFFFFIFVAFLESYNHIKNEFRLTEERKVDYDYACDR